MASWQLQEAKARLSELLRSAQDDGPQEITVHGRSAAILLSKEDYDRLRDAKPSFVDFMLSSPLAGTNLQVRRDPSKSRKVTL